MSDEGTMWEPGAWFDRPGEPAPEDAAQGWELADLDDTP